MVRGSPGGSAPPRIAALVAAVAGSLALTLPGCVGERGRTIPLSAVPPPGADDPANRGILIEGGSFMMGNSDPGAGAVRTGPYSTSDEIPARRVWVDPFWMQEHEVTNEEYRRFDPAHEFDAGQERFPVVNVTWQDAMDYAASVGGTLPTEPEWEFAARGRESRKYPWGDADPTCERAHYADCEPSGPIEVMTRPAGATPEGVHDLAGNVWEWVVPSWYDASRFPTNRESRRMRGGAFVSNAFFLRASNRNNEFFAGFSDVSVGFRVVWRLADGSN